MTILRGRQACRPFPEQQQQRRGCFIIGWKETPRQQCSTKPWECTSSHLVPSDISGCGTTIQSHPSKSPHPCMSYWIVPVRRGGCYHTTELDPLFTKEEPVRARWQQPNEHTSPACVPDKAVSSCSTARRSHRSGGCSPFAKTAHTCSDTVCMRHAELLVARQKHTARASLQVTPSRQIC